ncbi:MAG: hypothetical protein U5N86_11530 [Planctomycetota bacterium]|nr:hypothetical protein [Planctomycetota bacterium]
MNRIAALFAVLMCLATVLCGAEEQAEKPVELRSLFRSGCVAYVEIPSVDGFLRASSETGLAEMFAMEQMAELFSDTRAKSDLYKLVTTVLVKHEWGFAVGAYLKNGYVFGIRTRNGTAREFFETLLKTETGLEFDETLMPVEGEEGVYKSETGILFSFDAELMFVATSKAGLSFVGRDVDNSLAGLFEDSGAPHAPVDGYFVYANPASMPYTDIFDEGCERPFARLTGLAGAGTVFWTGRPSGSRFTDKLTIKPRSTGWSGLAAAADKNRSPVFSGRLSSEALFALAADIPASRLLEVALSEATEIQVKSVEGIQARAEKQLGMTLTQALDEAFTGDAEFSVSLPSGAILPRMALRFATSDTDKARALFELLNDDALRVLPLLTTVNGHKLYYRKPIAQLPYTPSAMFGADGFFAASSTVFVRSLLKDENPPFPPAEGYGSDLSQRFYDKSVASFLLDGKQAVRWAYNGLLIARAGEIQLPFDIAKLPLPDELALHFGYSSANIMRVEDTFVFESSSDVPLAGVAMLAWVLASSLL